jgi:hypothetical protein
MSEKLYLFHWDCGRMGFLDGLFIADELAVEQIIGKEIYFGEVLGKHSEIYGTLEEKEIVVISDDPLVISKLKEHQRFGSICGYNPIKYYEDQDDA